MGAFLVTGNPGSGKTTLARELSRRGYRAIDADELAGWETASGNEVVPPVDATDAWKLSHRWVWRRRLVSDTLSRHGADGHDVFLCGIARNQGDFVDLFDGIFLLALDAETQEERLRAPDNAHRSEALRDEIRRGRTVFEHEAQEAGALVLDASLPTDVLADRVLSAIARATASTAVQSLWRKYCAATGADAESLDVATPFGDSPAMADELLELVISGRKRATAGLLADFGEELPLPTVGAHWIVLDGTGTPACVLQTTDVRVGLLASVDDRFAWDEGEGDRTRKWWLAAHRGYFRRQGKKRGVPFDERAERVVFERFRVVWPDAAADH